MFKLFKRNKKPQDLAETPKVGMDMGAIRSKVGSKVAAMVKPMVSSEVSGFDRIINFCLLLLVFLLPILFLPFASEVREFNKQALLILAVLVMLVVWVIRVLSHRSFSFVKTPLDYILPVFLLVYLVSSLFSVDQVSSFLGYYGRFTASFASVLSLVVLYYLLVNHVSSQAFVGRLTKYLLISAGLVLVYSFLQLLGIFVLPFDFASDRAFNPIGSMVALGIFSAIFLVILQWQWLNDQSLTKTKRLVYLTVSVLSLLVIFLINAFIAWLVLGLGLICLLALSMVVGPQHQTTSWFWRPMVLLVIAILFIAFQFLPASLNPRRLIQVNLPIEIQLSQATTWNMVKNSVSSSVKQAVIGSGPGTTGLVFGDIKPETLNKTVVWNLNFDRASQETANLVIETGILGLLAFELTALFFLFYALHFLLKKEVLVSKTYAVTFFLIWVTLYFAHFFYFFNTTFQFLYWFSLSIFMTLSVERSESEAKILSFAASPRSAMSSVFVSLLLLAVLIVGGFFQVAVVMAETAYASGIRILNQRQPNFVLVNEAFDRAIRLNPYRDVYYLALGQNLIFLASEEAGKQNPNISNIQNWLAASVNAGLVATRTSPAKAGNWSALAQFYSNIKPLGIVGTDEAIVRNWEEAIRRDPKNPVLLVQLARAYSAAAEQIDPSIAGTGLDSDSDGLSDAREAALGADPKNGDSNGNGVSDGDEVKAGFNPATAGRLTAVQLVSFTKLDPKMLKSAEEALRKAIELKNDLPDSRIELARIFEKQNRLADARRALDEAARLFPTNADVKFEQGRIAYNQGNLAEAERIFKDVIRLLPNHANARYSLGLTYQQTGDKVRALAEFEKTREISGPNVELEKLINRLRAEIEK